MGRFYIKLSGPRSERMQRTCDFCGEPATWKRKNPRYHNTRWACDEHFKDLRAEPSQEPKGRGYETEGERQAFNMFGGKKWGL